MVLGASEPSSSCADMVQHSRGGDCGLWGIEQVERVDRVVGQHLSVRADLDCEQLRLRIAAVLPAVSLAALEAQTPGLSVVPECLELGGVCTGGVYAAAICRWRRWN